jgi:hypothetical protein
MSFGGTALTRVATKDLELLLSRVHGKAIAFPITHQTLLAAGLPQLVDRVAFLQGLDAAAVQAVLVAVIAERRAKVS